MPIKYIGRKTDFKGKSLWQILGNLKNYGVGRMVIRNKFQVYPEPSYMRILKVAALPMIGDSNPDVSSLIFFHLLFSFLSFYFILHNFL